MYFAKKNVLEITLLPTRHSPRPLRRELKKLRLKSLFWALCLLGVIIYVFAVLFTSFGQQEFQIIPVQPATGLLGGEVLVAVFVKQILEVLYHPLKGIIEPNHSKKGEKRILAILRS